MYFKARILACNFHGMYHNMEPQAERLERMESPWIPVLEFGWETKKKELSLLVKKLIEQPHTLKYI
jgi:hypothetical protein